MREESGLAMSSRNALLSGEEREKASVIYKALRAAKIAVKEGERNTAAVAGIVRSTIAGEPLAQLDYVAVVDNETLAPVEKIGENAVLIAVAARFGSVRLIDNTVINKRS